jgi:beta-galactosidase
MKNRIIFIFIVLIGFACQRASNLNNDEGLFDSDWKFFRGDVKGAENPSFNDDKWAGIDLPHDWSIEKLSKQDSNHIIGPFSQEASEGKRATGYTVGGIGWYRKHFTIDRKDEGKKIMILFDGVYMNADFWINGKHLGNHPYGYTSFSYDLTEYLQPAGKENVLAVQVKNEGRNSRWYSGSGIYRHVWLIKKQDVHIPVNGVFITPESISGNEANIKVKSLIEKTTSGESEVRLQITIKNQAGLVSQKMETQKIKIKSGENEFIQNLTLPQPDLWSLESPNLYTAEISVVADGEVKDHVSTTFGIRTIHFDAITGFTLNGKNVLLKGGCLHHDNGFLGSATIDRAEERRVEIMKANGFNAIRTAHNPPSKQFLDACDRLGVLVMDEAFDMWEKAKNPDDYHLYFKDWWKRDLESMILRDRNHPSVILWSVGNEIPERADSSGVAICKDMVSLVNQLDNTRPVTAGVCIFWERPNRPWSDVDPSFTYFDVCGYNYQLQQYSSDHVRFPSRVIVGTESYPASIYDNWKAVVEFPWVIGDFVWTGMDHLGEAGIGSARLVDAIRTGRGGFPRSVAWPASFNSFCGDIDLCGFKKTQSLYRDIVWKNSSLEIVVHSPIPEGKREMVSGWGWPDEFPCWNWKGNEGKIMDVRVFTNYKVIRLELNGKIIDKKTVADTSKLIVSFKVPYEPGVLKAIALENGKEVASKELKTTGSPAKVKLIADRTKIKSDRNDLSYVRVEITDAQGNFVPDAAVPVKFMVSGIGEIAGSGNALPNDMESFNSQVCKTYHGQALAILRPLKSQKSGTITLKAESDGLTTGEIKVIVQ